LRVILSLSRVILSLSRVILSLSRVILSLSKDEHRRWTRRISTMSGYAVIIEKSRTGYGAYVPDLPVPAPTTIAEVVEVAAVQAPARP
jgi:hypothetical protein